MPASPFDPFSYVFSVDLSSADWVLPPRVRAGQVRCTTEGTIKVDTLLTKGVNLLVTDYDILDAEVTKIYKTGTDAGLATGCITIFGWESTL
jgi:hypothetical protein